MSTRTCDQSVPESWLACVGGQDVTGWFAAFVTDPPGAVDDLLWNRFYFGQLNLTERGQILYGWLDAIGELDQFATRLDAALTNWVDENWGRFDRDATALASAWSCLCTVVEYSANLPGDSHLTRTATVLRDRFDQRSSFLGSFSTAPSSDPLGFYLAALAAFQGDDDSLLPLWHRMCDLPDGVPFYHARYAMLGLRRAKPVNRNEAGTLRSEIVLGLFRLARSFDRIARETPGLEQVLRRTLRQVAAQTAAAFPGSPRWRQNREALEELPDRARQWLVEAVPYLAPRSADQPEVDAPAGRPDEEMAVSQHVQIRRNVDLGPTEDRSKSGWDAPVLSVVSSAATDAVEGQVGEGERRATDATGLDLPFEAETGADHSAYVNILGQLTEVVMLPETYSLVAAVDLRLAGRASRDVGSPADSQAGSKELE